MLYYILESTAERRARRNNDIKHLFQHLTIDEGMSFMEAYEAVGYVFYLSAVGLGIGAFAFEVACIPTLAVGYSKMHRSVDIYNVGCSTAKTRPYWTLQASQNGIGLAYKF